MGAGCRTARHVLRPDSRTGSFARQPVPFLLCCTQQQRRTGSAAATTWCSGRTTRRWSSVSSAPSPPPPWTLNRSPVPSKSFEMSQFPTFGTARTFPIYVSSEKLSFFTLRAPWENRDCFSKKTRMRTYLRFSTAGTEPIVTRPRFSYFLPVSVGTYLTKSGLVNTYLQSVTMVT